MNVTACIPVLDQYSFTGPAVGWFTSPFSCVHLSAGVVFRVCVFRCVCPLFEIKCAPSCLVFQEDSVGKRRVSLPK